ncbi:MAG TPA: hypothetical protein VLU43_07160 [Anaeromyxobacteraceae bacterium]|nr:hypothetical protein [Anaeromyxobacteraceae bacterium]
MAAVRTAPEKEICGGGSDVHVMDPHDPPQPDDRPDATPRRIVSGSAPDLVAMDDDRFMQAPPR